MALVLNEEQSMLRDSARGISATGDGGASAAAGAMQRTATGFSRELLEGVRRDGFSGMLVPEDSAASGLVMLEAGVVRGNRRTLMPSPFLPPPLLERASARVTRRPCRAEIEHLPELAEVAAGRARHRRRDKAFAR